MAYKLKDIYIGNKKIKEVWVGNKLVWQKPSDWPGLKFTANQDNSTIKYYKAGREDLYISQDLKAWTPWNGSTIALNNGQSIYVWNKNNILGTADTFCNFAMSGSIAASGNVNSMINFSELTPHCYEHMFYNCTALTTPPELPSTNLDEYCYYAMFSNCTGLTTAPDLPATTLVTNCYSEMFSGCTNLNSIKLSYTGNFNLTSFDYWVGGVSSNGTLYYNGSDTTRGDSAIPKGWEVQSF